MENKTTKVNRLRLSPNEETQFVREELERRRKIRVQQEPDWCALAQTTNENNERAMKRHQQALRHLPSQRQEEVQRSRQIEARKKALLVEKKRAAKVASRPQPLPNPIESIGMQTFLPSMAYVQDFSITYCHMPETPVDRDADILQSDTQQAAMLEAQRLEELERQEVSDRQKQLQMAQLRGGHALQKEKAVQDSARILCELDRLQQADLQERKQVVYNVPAQIFQQSYRCDEQQRELEMAFQDLYNAGKEVRDDFVLVPEPLSAPSVGSDEDLDVTLETTSREKTEAENASPAPPSQPIVNFGQTAVKRLLERIRSQRVQWNWQECTPGQGSATLENTSIELGSMTNQEWKYAPSLQEGKSYESQNAEIGLKVTEEPIRDGSMLLIEEQFTETKRSLWEWEQFRQQEKQLNFLYQLEDKRRYLEVQLLEAQLYREMPQNAVQVHIEMARNV
ncbi:centrosomal protein of 295 kDa isoform X3 [Salminus brasiliensis]|uniref:centrosomal protein of 295 kDa isoform X3 n=1 Tax=Salminus brasiliensis TaxID=930266 RepID=UPI003B833153